MDRDARLKRLRFRAWHRGTKEADLLVGGFFDRNAARWSMDEIAWYEALMNEQDADIIGWAIGTIPVPPDIDGPMIRAMQALDYIPIAE